MVFIPLICLQLCPLVSTIWNRTSKNTLVPIIRTPCLIKPRKVMNNSMNHSINHTISHSARFAVFRNCFIAKTAGQSPSQLYTWFQTMYRLLLLFAFVWHKPCYEYNHFLRYLACFDFVYTDRKSARSFAVIRLNALIESRSKCVG